ncbi:DUF4946 domain-containing protein [Pseudomonas fuscovaginae UPB0736]|uniref:DUF4946 domain-containing protein n=1 Tax=Pseudomonas asplenii TaxID=53407 RepID=A0A1H6P0W6_9PSED|nr:MULTISPECIES: DUF4946 domain-containing protein [Pseudomonas]UUQ65146.1 DUF4946 domain-containing protein [Pseudomonas fuscovaginae UPB0736]UZE31633.1 DUF4946 domain-containing protein [Pseudomonas asplenii]SDT24587.1 protein of unknown function [Pseudomonas asplenii]SEI19221.1 protein of unknown function [Pseudomonas fuscovaginae]
MTPVQSRACFTALLLLLCGSSAVADDLMITWPGDWEVQTLPPAQNAAGEVISGLRQRAVKNDANGDPLMVMELTQSALTPGHEVNLPGVLLEMRKAVQKNFVERGFMSVCNHIHDSTLGGMPAVETTCTITQNGGHVMTQTLVAAAREGKAYSLLYAGSADGYKAQEAAVNGIRASLHLEP